MAKLKFLLFYFLLMALSIVVIIRLYPRIHPYAGINLTLNKQEIEKSAYRVAEELGTENREYVPNARFERNTALLRQLQMEMGLEQANLALREPIPAYYWRIFWIDKKEDLPPPPPRVEDNKLIPSSQLDWRFTLRGKLLKYQANIPEDTLLTEISESEARKIASDFLSRYSDFYDPAEDSANQKSAVGNLPSPQAPANGLPLTFVSSKKIQLSNRTDYEFNWTARLPETGNNIRVRLATAGNRVSSFEAEIDVPAIYSPESRGLLAKIFSPLLMIAIAIITIVIAFKRWRAYELSFRFAIPLGIIVALSFGVYLYNSLPPNMGPGFIFSLLFAPLTIGGTFIFVWAVGESVGRETWNDKFATLDLLRNGYMLHSRVGQSLVRGLAYGLLGLALWLALLAAVSNLKTLTVIDQNENLLGFVGATSPLIHFFSLQLFSSIYVVTAYFVLILSLLRKRISSPYLSLPLVALFLVLAYQGSIQPPGIGVMIDALNVLLIAWAFYRFDIITGFIAMFTSITAEPAVSLFLLGSADHLFSGYLLIGIAAALLIYAIIAIFSKDHITDLQRIAPAYVKNITERQRLQRELEIAREVQMSFLPKTSPRFTRLDIASRCEPAQEVGGDYYDFIELGGNRLGIVIGDVSGKGTQAAFYMTLTKGFLRALANTADSPAVVLTQLNRLFYDNVRRGVFISMAYGIFDMDEGTLTLARAGHNPVIMHKSTARESQALHPRGLALGMEKGSTFQQTIQDVKISFRERDLFVFYTDGFTEAMNKDKQEFGDERFAKAIENHSGGSAEQIMEGIFREVRQFTGKTPRHDDMTIVVAKISGDGAAAGKMLGNIGIEETENR